MVQMDKFGRARVCLIKLTQVRVSDLKDLNPEILISPASIETIEAGRAVVECSGGEAKYAPCTYISTAWNSYYVQESPEEIMERVQRAVDKFNEEADSEHREDDYTCERIR